MSIRTLAGDETETRLPYMSSILGFDWSRCLPLRMSFMPRMVSILPASLMRTTSNTPSVGEADGAICIPPPKNWQLAMTTCCAFLSSWTDPSMSTVIGLFLKLIRACSPASVYVALPNRFVPLPTMCTTSPPRPASAMLMKCRTPVEPSAFWYVTQPASSLRTMPLRRTSIACRVSIGMRSVRRKSPPVPSGTMASLVVVGSGAPLRKNPLTTSFRVPSPPTATTTGRDSRTARCAISVASSGRVVLATSYGNPDDGSHDSTTAHSRPALPAPDAGLTMKRIGAPGRLPISSLPGRAGSSSLPGPALPSPLSRRASSLPSHRQPTWRGPGRLRGDG